MEQISDWIAIGIAAGTLAWLPSGWRAILTARLLGCLALLVATELLAEIDRLQRLEQYVRGVGAVTDAWRDPLGTARDATLQARSGWAETGLGACALTVVVVVDWTLARRVLEVRDGVDRRRGLPSLRRRRRPDRRRPRALAAGPGAVSALRVGRTLRNRDATLPDRESRI